MRGTVAKQINKIAAHHKLKSRFLKRIWMRIPWKGRHMEAFEIMVATKMDRVKNVPKN